MASSLGPSFPQPIANPAPARTFFRQHSHPTNVRWLMGPSNSASFTGQCLAAHGTSWLSFGVFYLPSHVRTCWWRAEFSMRPRRSPQPNGHRSRYPSRYWTVKHGNENHCFFCPPGHTAGNGGQRMSQGCRSGWHWHQTQSRQTLPWGTLYKYLLCFRFVFLCYMRVFAARAVFLQIQAVDGC